MKASFKVPYVLNFPVDRWTPASSGSGQAQNASHQMDLVSCFLLNNGFSVEISKENNSLWAEKFQGKDLFTLFFFYAENKYFCAKYQHTHINAKAVNVTDFIKALK